MTDWHLRTPLEGSWRPLRSSLSASARELKELPSPLQYPSQNAVQRLAFYGVPFESKHPYFQDPGLQAFLDFSVYSPEWIVVQFINVAPEYEGLGLSRLLFQALYDRYPEKKIKWGRIMDDAIDHLKEDFRQRFPDRTAGAEEFHQDAARLLEEYAQLARDVARTLPEAEWPRWVKNQILMQSEVPDAMPIDDAPGDTIFPEDWNRLAMAERSGDPELDRLIDEYMFRGYATEDTMGENIGDDPLMTFEIDHLREPGNAAGMCSEVSLDFWSFLRSRGIEATIQEATPDAAGYTDRNEIGESCHDWVEVSLPSGTYMVDFTPAQYGYKELPMVQRLDDKGNWQRKWSSDWLQKSMDSWSGPQSVNLKEDAEIPGEAGMRSMEQYGFNPPETKDNWLYLNGEVVFGGHYWDLAHQLATKLKLPEDQVRLISNSVARNHLPAHIDIAYGEMRNGYPQIWASTLDRNAVWDAVARKQQNNPSLRHSAYWNPQTGDHVRILPGHYREGEVAKVWFVSNNGDVPIPYVIFPDGEQREYTPTEIVKSIDPGKLAGLTVNPVNYEFIPLTPAELASPHEVDWGWGRKAQRNNRRARQYGASGNVHPRELAALARRFEYGCAYCGKKLDRDTLTFDHVIPLWLGGNNDASNLLPTCGNCNASMNDWDTSLNTHLHPTFWQQPEEYMGLATASRDRISTMTPKMGEKAMIALIEHGGFSFNVNGSAVEPGYFVSIEGHERVISLVSITPEDIDNYIHDHKGILRQPNNFVGGWVSNGNVFLDVSKSFQTEPEAMEFGAANHQEAIYDAFNDVVIPVRVL